MAGDHGNITIINKSAEWDAKIEEAKSSGKIVKTAVNLLLFPVLYDVFPL